MDKAQDYTLLPLEQIVDMFYNLSKGQNPDLTISGAMPVPNGGSEHVQYTVHMHFKKSDAAGVYIEVTKPSMKEAVMGAFKEFLSVKYSNDVITL